MLTHISKWSPEIKGGGGVFMEIFLKFSSYPLHVELQVGIGGFSY